MIIIQVQVKTTLIDSLKLLSLVWSFYINYNRCWNLEYNLRNSVWKVFEFIVVLELSETLNVLALISF